MYHISQKKSMLDLKAISQLRKIFSPKMAAVIYIRLNSEFHSNVRYLALSFGSCIGQENNRVVYGQKELKYLDKQYLKIIDPKHHIERLQKQKEYDKNRDQTEERKIARLRLSCDSYCTLSESTKLLKLLYFNYEY